MKLSTYKSETERYFYDDDQRFQGEYKRYDDNGNTAEHCFFRDDNLHGEYKLYSNERLIQHTIYADDKVIVSDPATLTPEDKAFLILQHDIKFFTHN